jgi:hypothetical protein
MNMVAVHSSRVRAIHGQDCIARGARIEKTYSGPLLAVSLTVMLAAADETYTRVRIGWCNRIALLHHNRNGNSPAKLRNKTIAKFAAKSYGMDFA